MGEAALWLCPRPLHKCHNLRRMHIKTKDVLASMVCVLTSVDTSNDLL